MPTKNRSVSLESLLWVKHLGFTIFYWKILVMSLSVPTEQFAEFNLIMTRIRLNQNNSAFLSTSLVNPEVVAGKCYHLIIFGHLQ